MFNVVRLRASRTGAWSSELVIFVLATLALVATVFGEAVFVDVSLGSSQNGASGRVPKAVIDGTADVPKLLVVTSNEANANRLSLFRCSLDVSDCTHHDLSAGRGERSGMTPSAAVDSFNGKLIVATQDNSNANKPALFRCDVTGTGCTYHDISAGAAANSGETPSVFVDDTNDKICVVTLTASSLLTLFRCDLTGSNCVHTDISLSQLVSSPTALYDKTNLKLLVSVSGPSGSAGLFVCDLDGANCSYHDISAGQVGVDTCVDARGALDLANGKVIVAGLNFLGGSNRLSVYRCELSGTACTHTDVASERSNSGFEPAVVVPPFATHVYFLTRDDSMGGRLSLFRCTVDVVTCAHTDASAGQSAMSATQPSAVLSPTGDRLLTVMANAANFSRPTVYVTELLSLATVATVIVSPAAEGLAARNPSAVLSVAHGLLVAATNVAARNKLVLYCCTLDGLACKAVDISAGEPPDSGFAPSAVVYEPSSKVLVVTRNAANANRLSLFACNTDGTLCVHTDISAGAEVDTGHSPSAVVDRAGLSLLVVSIQLASSNKLLLFRCDLNGSFCSYIDISAGQLIGAGTIPSAAVDESNSKLLVAASNSANGYAVSLVRCDLSGTSCELHHISAAMFGSQLGREPTLLLDMVGVKLLVVTRNDVNRVTLTRCALAGTNCEYHDISAGQDVNTGLHPHATIDTANSQLVVVAQHGSTRRPGLYRCTLNATDCVFTDIVGSQTNGLCRNLEKGAQVVIAPNTTLVLCADVTQYDRLAVLVQADSSPSLPPPLRLLPPPPPSPSPSPPPPPPPPPRVRSAVPSTYLGKDLTVSSPRSASTLLISEMVGVCVFVLFGFLLVRKRNSDKFAREPERWRLESPMDALLARHVLLSTLSRVANWDRTGRVARVVRLALWLSTMLVVTAITDLRSRVGAARGGPPIELAASQLLATALAATTGTIVSLCSGAPLIVAGLSSPIAATRMAAHMAAAIALPVLWGLVALLVVARSWAYSEPARLTHVLSVWASAVVVGLALVEPVALAVGYWLFGITHRAINKSVDQAAVAPDAPEDVVDARTAGCQDVSMVVHDDKLQLDAEPRLDITSADARDATTTAVSSPITHGAPVETAKAATMHSASANVPLEPTAPTTQHPVAKLSSKPDVREARKLEQRAPTK